MPNSKRPKEMKNRCVLAGKMPNSSALDQLKKVAKFYFSASLCQQKGPIEKFDRVSPENIRGKN